MQTSLILFGFSLKLFLKDFSIVCYIKNALKLQSIYQMILWIIFIETVNFNCWTRIFSITFFLNFIQFDAKLARVQTKSKSYPDATVLPQSIYRRVCEINFLNVFLQKLPNIYLNIFNRLSVSLCQFYPLYLTKLKL